MNDNKSAHLDNKSSAQRSQTKNNQGFLKNPRKWIIVGSIILLTALIVVVLNVFKPEAKKRDIPETIVRVDVIKAKRANYPVVVNANGTIEAETRGNLVAQIRGEIVEVADNFKTGGAFKQGDVLAKIDPRDYQAALSQATAALSQADAAYRQEQASAKQANDDWARLGNTETAPDLVRRVPQLAAAKAQLNSAKAANATAKLNLTRTQVTAPYAGRIIERNATLGQYVSVGSPLAEVFSTDGVEVKLPISQNEYSQLGLDQFDTSSSQSHNFKVLLKANIGNQHYHWNAKISRTDSTFDVNTRQIDVIAEVEDPLGAINKQPELKIGQFVSATIQGKTLEDVYVIPNKSIREGRYAYLVKDGRLTKQTVEIIWQDDQNTIVTKGVTNNDLIVTTSLNSTLAGARAKLPDEFSTQQPTANKPSTTETSN